MMHWCTRTTASVRMGTALGLLEVSDVAKSATLGTGEAVSYLVRYDDSYVLGAGKVAEQLS